MKGCVIKYAEIRDQERKKIRRETGHTIPRIIIKNMMIGWETFKIGISSILSPSKWPCGLKGWICCLYLAGIVGSNPVGGMEVCLL